MFGVVVPPGPVAGWGPDVDPGDRREDPPAGTQRQPESLEVGLGEQRDVGEGDALAIKHGGVRGELEGREERAGVPPFSAAAAALIWLGWGIGGSGGWPGVATPTFCAVLGGGPAGSGGGAPPTA